MGLLDEAVFATFEFFATLLEPFFGGGEREEPHPPPDELPVGEKDDLWWMEPRAEGEESPLAKFVPSHLRASGGEDGAPL